MGREARCISGLHARQMMEVVELEGMATYSFWWAQDFDRCGPGLFEQTATVALWPITRQIRLIDLTSTERPRIKAALARTAQSMLGPDEPQAFQSPSRSYRACLTIGSNSGTSSY